MSIIQRLIDNGNIEELFLHEGSHISLDRLIEVHKISLKLLLLSFKKDMKRLKILIVDLGNATMNLNQGTDEWLCARQQDKNFISTYARDHVTRFYF